VDDAEVSVLYSDLNKVKKILRILILKREEKARIELDIDSLTDNDTQRIDETSMASFFKISSVHMKEAIPVNCGTCITDPSSTIVRYNCTVDEYHEF